MRRRGNCSLHSKNAGATGGVLLGLGLATWMEVYTYVTSIWCCRTWLAHSASHRRLPLRNSSIPKALFPDPSYNWIAEGEADRLSGSESSARAQDETFNRYRTCARVIRGSGVGRV